MTDGKEEIRARLKSLVEWTKKEVQSQPTSKIDQGDTTSEHNETCGEKICFWPSEEDVGVEEKFVKLCATLAGGVYQTTSKKEFEKTLTSNSELKEAFPELTVRFFQTGITIGRLNSKSKVSLNAPTLAGVIVGDTLVLAFRGTVTIADMVADIKMDSVQPWRAYEGLEVQRAYYNLIQDEYIGKDKSHKKDIINYINGKYSKVPNKAKLDGTPIKRILITGHSLGGGLAQVTHLCLKAKGGGFDDLVEAIEENNVEVQTIAFAAPMTTCITPSDATVSFVDNSIRPNMRNICYKADPVPRGYANIVFILDLLDDIKAKFLAAKSHDDLAKMQSLMRVFQEGLLPWTSTFLEGTMDSVIDQAAKYQHIGKVLYYDTEHDKPAAYLDCDVCSEEEAATKKFRDLKYKPSSDDPIEEAMKFHSFLVTEKGLGYS